MHFTDQLNNTIELASPPQRIISLVPSQTELLCDLGLEEHLIGVTKFCVHPPHIRKTKHVVGGTKNLRMDEIRKLNPDLIIANKEENEQAQVEALAKEFPVWTSDIHTFDDAIKMIGLIGELTGRTLKAKQVVEEIAAAKDKFLGIRRQEPGIPNPELRTRNKENRTKNQEPGTKNQEPRTKNQEPGIPNTELRTQNPEPRTLYLIWRNPWMSVGGDTFISHMLELAGFNNLLKDQYRYPTLTDTELSNLNPELILLSSEPYPFNEKHIAELQVLCPGSRILLVDGELFSWYGSRMIQSFEYFERLHQLIANR